MNNKTAANSKRTAKAKPRGKPWPKGTSGNPGGRPKDGESWAGVIKELANMTPEEVQAMVGDHNPLGRAFAKMPRQVQMKYLISARVMAQLMFEPTGGLWNGLMDRQDGKVPDRLVHEGRLSVDGLKEMLEKVYGRNPAAD